MKIADIECHVLVSPGFRADGTSSSQDDIVVVVHTDEGITGIGIAASAHMAAAIPNCPYFEFLPAEMCDSHLRRDLVNDPLVMEDGLIRLPDRPGLGVELNRDALEKYAWRP
jgi:L-alanine-DL-glutamate epimerase-like enolase superfamily enzyme